jgi:hypothetical protein
MTSMRKYRQSITDPAIGDCFRACMATLLQIPPQVLPNDFSPSWHWNWQRYLEQFGLALSHSGRPDGAIWLSTPWIASVRSLNFEGGLHAILMHQANVVLHDPSTHTRYKTGTRLRHDDGTVQSGQHLIVTDTDRLQHLVDYRQWLRANGALT